MKIVYLSASNIPSKAANSINVTNMCQAFYELGHEVSLITPIYLNTLEDNIYDFYGIDKNIRIHRKKRSKSKLGLLVYLFNVCSLLIKIKPDKVVGRCVYSCFIATILGFEVVFDSHRPEWEGGRIYYMIFKRMLSFKNLQRLVLNSNALFAIYLNESLLKKFTFKMVVANNGAREFPLNEKVPLPGKSNMKIGYIGHLYRGRGIDIIIECANKLSDFDFILVGGENIDVAHWKNEVKGSNVYFLGFISPQEIYKYRNSFDILLAPYQKDVYTPAGFNQVVFMNPIKIIEYMSSQKPIIASSLPAIQDVLENEKNGILVTSDSVDEWCSQLKRLNLDRILSQKIAVNSHKDFLNRFTWKSRAEKFLNN